jgi:DNA-binding NtrC family response regulator
LVVDDDPTLRSVLRRRPHQHGYATIEAADGAEAVRAIERSDRPIAVCLSDVNMPLGMGGIELGKITAVRWPVMLLIYASGNETLRSLQQQLPGVPIEAFFQKPYDAESVMRFIDQALGRAQRPDGSFGPSGT